MAIVVQTNVNVRRQIQNIVTTLTELASVNRWVS